MARIKKAKSQFRTITKPRFYKIIFLQRYEIIHNVHTYEYELVPVYQHIGYNPKLDIIAKYQNKIL